MSYLSDDDPLAQSLKAAIQGGDVDHLGELLAGHPGAATVRIGSADESRTLLHIATDWPGNFPNVADTIARLIAGGAGVDASFEGFHTETALHWAASCDDVAAIDALLDAGAAIDATGAVLGGGAPLADAVGFRQWNAARRLVERGAQVRIEHAAALGMIERVRSLLSESDAETTTIALWSACTASQLEAAELLIEHGGDINWIGWDHATCLDLALGNGDEPFAAWLRQHGALTTAEQAAR